MNQNTSVGLIGNGSWATALAKMLSNNLPHFHWWIRNDETIHAIKTHKHNPKYLSSVEFNTDKISFTSDLNEIFKHTDIVIVAVPSIYIDDCFEHLNVDISNKILVSAVKGIIPSSSQVLGEYLLDKYQVKPENFVVISGPCHAEEVALERLSYLTLACDDLEKANTIASILKNYYIKTNLSQDVNGTEYAAILKNIYAIAAGIFHGLGYGDNFQAVLMSNAAREMERYVNQVFPMENRDINESSYLGDLLVTGYSYFSRNRMLGNYIGKGYTVKAAILEMQMVAEGYYATNGCYNMKKKLSVEKTPIIAAVYKVLYEGKNPKKVFSKLTEKLN